MVESIIRGGSDGSGRRRGVERTLEGWLSSTGTPCELSVLESLKIIWSRKIVTAEEVFYAFLIIPLNQADIVSMT